MGGYCGNRPLNHDLQPSLYGELVALRPLRADDFHSLYAVASDPLLWTQHPAPDRYQRNVFELFFRDALGSGGALLATDRLNGMAIGTSRYSGYDRRKEEIEIGWTFLARSHWGGRYNGEMKRLMLQHAFTFVKHVIFVIGVSNFRSQRAVEKIGAARIGMRLDGAGIERVVYRIDAADRPAWPACR
jgi:N-acetyltransferase